MSEKTKKEHKASAGVSKKIGPVELIGKVEHNYRFEKVSQDFFDFLGALNPLGHISDTIARILEYKVEIKRLEVEGKRIEREAKIRHHQIDAALKVAISMLNERREAIRGFLSIASKEIDNCHVERMAIVRTIDNLNDLIKDKKVSLETRKMAIESLPIMTKLLSDYGDKGSAAFKQLVDTTQKAIDHINAPSARHLLSFPTE
ncbi:hypothetical protein D6779_08665 [Candidatus Parcubacteria bacterium]|nr:MAG: hypothetical protein D6779_08665 [Candidatus Parcubacteria bacterium]